MYTTKEFAVQMEGSSGSFGKVCQALTNGGVNILALHHSTPTETKGLVRFVVDDPVSARKVLEGERLAYTEAEVAKLPHRPGELARSLSKLGEASIKVSHAYCGVEPSTSAPLLILGVSEVNRAIAVIDPTGAVAMAAPSVAVIDPMGGAV